MRIAGGATLTGAWIVVRVAALADVRARPRRPGARARRPVRRRHDRAERSIPQRRDRDVGGRCRRAAHRHRSPRPPARGPAAQTARGGSAARGRRLRDRRWRSSPFAWRATGGDAGTTSATSTTSTTWTAVVDDARRARHRVRGRGGARRQRTPAGGARWFGLWIAFVAIAAAYVLLYPLLLSPRLAPLEDRALAGEIERLARQAGLGETTVEVRKARERTRAVNAEAIGAGPTTRVILWDTLLEPDVGRDEIRRRRPRARARRPTPRLEGRRLVRAARASGRVAARTDGQARGARVGAGRRARAGLSPAVDAAARERGLTTLRVPGADYEALRLASSSEAAERLYRRFVRTDLADPDPPRSLDVLLSTHPTVVERIAMAPAQRFQEVVDPLDGGAPSTTSRRARRESSFANFGDMFTWSRRRRGSRPPRRRGRSARR